MTPVNIFAQKNSVFLEEINVKIEDLKSAGLIDYWCSKFIRKGREKEAINEVTVFKFRHVKACFILLSMGIGASLITFLLEMVLKLFLKK